MYIVFDKVENVIMLDGLVRDVFFYEVVIIRLYIFDW